MDRERSFRRIEAIGAILTLAAAVVVAFPRHASAADRAFARRFTADVNGSITIAANTLMTCPLSETNCNSAREGGAFNNNQFTMKYVDVLVDGSTTFDSSTATLRLPADATVLFAGLYWSADTSKGTGSHPGDPAPDASKKNQVVLFLPDGSTTTVAASVLDTSTSTPTRYQGFADVTTIVKQQGTGNREYAIGNVQAGTGEDRYAAWSLVVAFSSPTLPARNLTIFDGFQTVNQSHSSVDIPLTGFRTPASGPVRTTLGFAAYEGDLGSTGDSATLNTTTLTDGLNPINNFFNSSITQRGTRITTKDQDYVNQLGFDADLISADNVLANNATTATIHVKTNPSNGETYFPGVVTFATDLFAPRVEPQKTATDVNGAPLRQGDLIRYTVSAQNTGEDGATGLTLTDSIPAGTTYEPNSLQVVSSPGGIAGPKTDAAGDDQGEFTGTAVRFRLGTGASPTSGGVLAVGQTYAVTFLVRVSPPAPDGTTITNQASNSYGAQSNPSFSGTDVSSPPTILTVSAPDLVLAKTHQGTFVRGSTGSFRLTVTNNGSVDTTGTVTVTDTVPAALPVTSASGPGWACGTVGQIVTCSRSDPLAASGSYQPITIGVNVAPAAPGSITNTASASGGQDGDPSNNEDSDAVAIGSSADLSVVKTIAPAVPVAGGPVTFHITVSNDGPSTATGVTVTDDLPGQVLSPTVTTSQGSCSIAAGTVSCDLGAVAASDSATVTVAGTLRPGSGGQTLSNTATAGSDDPDPDPSNDSDTATHAIVGRADLSVVKTITPAVPVAGGPVTFHITVSNDGPSTATGVTVTDDLPGQVLSPTVTTSQGSCSIAAGTVSCDIGDLAVGDTATVTVQGTLRPGSGGQTLSNTASVGSDDPDPDMSNNDDTATRTVGASADLSVVKTITPAVPVAGGPVTFHITVSNDGPSTATGVTVTDDLPGQVLSPTVTTSQGSCSIAAGTVSCDLGAVAASDSATVTVAGTLRPGSGGQTLSNTATAGSDDPDPDPSNDSDTASADISSSADLSVVKTITPAALVPGGPVTFHITVSNDGPSTATGVVVTDPLPTELTSPTASSSQGSCSIAAGTVSCDIGDLAVGDTATVTVQGTLRPGSGGQTITNTAQVSSDDPDPDMSNNDDTATRTVGASADLSVVKTITPAVPVAGGPVTFHITVSNDGPSTATGVTVTDDLPGQVLSPTVTTSQGSCSIAAGTVSCDLGAVAASDSATVTVAGTLRPGSGGQTLSNTATAGSDDPDPDPSNDSDTATHAIVGRADLSVVKTIAPAVPVAGGPVTFHITVSNDGPSTATGVTVTDDLPGQVLSPTVTTSQGSCSIAAGTVSCDIGDQGVGDSATVTVHGTLRPGSGGQTLSNTATAGSDDPDPDPSNDSDTASADISSSADLSVVKTITPAALVPGGPVTFHITVSNDGPSTATGVVVTDPLPTELTSPTASSSQGSCSIAAGTVSCDLGAVAASDSATVTVAGTLRPGSGGQTLSNTATAGSDDPDPDPSNDSDTATHAIVGRADLSVVKTITPAVPVAGGPVTFHITVSNDGPSTATGVTVTDDLPGQVLSPTVTTSQGSCSIAAGTVSCDLGAVAASDSATVTVAGTLRPGSGGQTLSNTATAGSDDPDPDPSNDSDTASADISSSADLSVVKTITPAALVPGGPVTFHITVSNDGPSTATGVVVTDPLPTELTSPTASSSQGSCSIAAGTVSCDIGDLAVGDTATVTVQGTLRPGSGGQTITNTAQVSSDDPDPDMSNNDDTATRTVGASADLSVVKTITPAVPVAGGPVTFHITVSNDGPSTATGVTVTDDLPGQVLSPTVTTSQGSCSIAAGTVSCDLGAVAASDSATVTVAGTLRPGSGGQTLSNTATAGSDDPDPDPSNDSDTATHAIVGRADLSVVKTITPAVPVAGGPVTFHITVSNDGPSTATGVTVTDDLPGQVLSPTVTTSQGSCSIAAGTVSCDLGAVAASDSATVTVAGTLRPGSGGQTLSNTATAGSDDPDPDPSNDSDTASADISSSADLSVVKTITPAPPLPRGPVTFTLVVTNHGPGDARAVRVTDPLPPEVRSPSATSSIGACSIPAGIVRCSLGFIAPGHRATVTIEGDLRSSSGGKILANTATVGTQTTDPVEEDNSSTASRRIATPAADLIVDKRVSRTPLIPGGMASWVIFVRNLGPNAATQVMVRDHLAPAVRFPSADPSQGSCSIRAHVVTCRIGRLAVGSEATVVVHAELRADVRLRVLRNHASATADEPDPRPENAHAFARANVAHANLHLTKSAGRSNVVAGDRLRFTITLRNTGMAPARNVQICDRLPPHMFFISAARAHFVNGQACWHVSRITDGAVVRRTVVAEVDRDAPGGVQRNTAVVVTPSHAGRLIALAPVTVHPAPPVPPPPVTG